MKIREIENGLVVRLELGEEVIDSLTRLAEEGGINGASFHGLGGASQATLGIYRIDTDNEYHFTEFNEALEIISMNGNIARDEQGAAMVHCHASISGVDLKAYGGHVKSMMVAGTCEVFIDFRTGPLTRIHDDEVGLKLLDL